MSALSGFRVVEVAEQVAGEYCGKLLADLGADVVKVERPGWGSPTRALAPRVGDGSALFAYLNTNKRSAELDLAGVHELIATADAVIDDHGETWAAAHGLTEAEVTGRHPGVVFCAVTPYGRTAPPEFDTAVSLNVFHAGGWGYHTPSHADPARPPLKGPGRFLADYEGALDAALCVASALFDRMHTGRGEFIDVSQQAVLVSRADCMLGRFLAGEIAPQNRRDDYDQAGPASFFACRDEFVYLYMTSRAHWLGLKTLMGSPDWLDEFADDWLEFGVTPQRVADFRRGFAAWMSSRPGVATAEQAQRLGVPLVPVNDAADLLNSPQYRHRRFFRDVTHPDLGRAAYPTAGYRLSASEDRSPVAAPTLGQHTAEVLAEARRPRTPPAVLAPQLKVPCRARGGPLQGVRVVELTKVWAGPYAGKLLAFLGAEVIKVENSRAPEEMRAYGGTDVNHAPYFLSINPEILSVDLDIKTRQGRDALCALIARSDIVLDNLRPGAMERQGLAHRDLVALKHDIISVSIKMWGNDGPLGHQTGYAPCFAALAGLASLVGYPGGPPLGASMRYGDSTVGAAAAFAAVAALLHRDRTGEGQFVDVSAVEVLSSMIGDCLFEQNLTGRLLGPDGNRHPDMAPHGCYPCVGDNWISIAVANDGQWHRLCAVLGADHLAADARYRDSATRHRNLDSLDADLSALTDCHDATDLAHRLRAAGVGAAKSATVTDVIGDELLWQRGAYRFVSDRLEGRRPVLGPPWRMSRPADIDTGAPDLGEHNDYVLGDIFGQQGARTT
ncbi:Crotonobetainyl-CoA:carnitine CoA-transferase CaiB [Mycolicibacterium rutilum]|uniref:Crotonobetainyl-CoA:carnitine CoA-transferase CaiB n=1 Tax=Mycolicibacterium rutilum TaxID=370526 RepID=A0A1H6LSW1_MYCRU|nr:CoA transferase [Mycolicibacterium rutilum]SEH88567.1 Crotonobetainyl-CoA:carnitine CoA-transferase CaiB [Mycolicibacterium rutilum]